MNERTPLTSAPAPSTELPRGVQVIIGFHIVNLCLWIVGQAGALVNYDWVASIGLQDPREMTDQAIVANSLGIATTDTLILLPLLALATVGLLTFQFYGVICSWMVFAVSMYWTMMFWMTAGITYVSANIEHVPVRLSTLVPTAAIFGFSVWGSWYLCRNEKLLIWWERDFM